MIDREGEQAETDGLIGGALFCRAVIFYARATDTSSNSRRPSGIRDRLPEELKPIHALVMKYRNDALAHFGGIEDSWAASASILYRLENESRLLSPHYGANYFGDFAIDLSGLIDAAIVVCSAKAEERSSDVFAALDAELQTSAELQQAISSSPFDPADFFPTRGGAESFERAMAQPSAPYEQSHGMTASAARHKAE